MALLESVRSPADVKSLKHEDLAELAGEIRQFLIDKVSRTGGHLGPNLGAVELTLAVHRVFNSPDDAVVFDTGHQSYVHKMLTGRQGGFDQLRKSGGLSGYPSRAESEHDLVENSHASTALSYADGLARSFQLKGLEQHAVAVVGDGALTGGMCWEALNNIAGDQDRPVVIIVNDNGRSYAPTIGGLAEHLTSLRLNPSYERALESGRRTLRNLPVVGRSLYTGLHAAKSGIKDAISPQVMFSDLGLKYLGPVDGHDLRAMESALTMAKSFNGPVIVHAVTRKGNGFAPAENDQAEQMHQVKVINPETGLPTKPAPRSWSDVYAEELVRIGGERPDIVAMTAAMLGPTGLQKFADVYPDRCIDVGIAEQHGMTSAAGLAMGGMHPVFAVYSTFLNRAFDQLLMDVALHRQPVTVTLDRSGITGDDGPSHNGMWDLSILGIVPGIRVAAPRDAVTLREELREAVAVDDGPTVVRFSKGSVIEEIPAVERVNGVDVLRRCQAPAERSVLLVSVGVFAQPALAAAERLAAQGIEVTVVDPRWVVPVPDEIVDLASRHSMVVTVEDCGRHGGFGWALAAALRDAGVAVPLRDLAVPNRFLDHASRDEVLSDLGLTEQDIAERVGGWFVNCSGAQPELQVTAEELPGTAG